VTRPTSQLPPIFPSRATIRLAALLASAVFINYIDRVNLATAAPLLKDEFHLTATQMGLLLSAFFWTYGPGQLLAGSLAERFGVRWLMAAGVGLWSIATAVTGVASSFGGLLILRLVLGLGESVVFPCSSRELAQNVALSERGRANAAISIGIALGPAFGTFAGAMLMIALGWRPVFIAFGLASLLWIWPWLAARAPVAERLGERQEETSPGFLEILSKRSAWGAALGHFCVNYGFYFVISWLPLYLVKERGFSITTMAQLTGTNYLLQALGAALAGATLDRWITAGISANRAYKSAMVISGLGTAACFLGCAMGGLRLATACILASGLLVGVSSPVIFSIAQTLAGPRASGRWVGFQNFVANFAGILAPVITGFIIDRTGHFTSAFVLAAGVLSVGVIGWGVIIRTVAPVQWTDSTSTSDQLSNQTPKSSPRGHA
jgi:MFS family permease